MIKKINRFGEVSYSKNEALVTMPFIRLETENIELLEENYRQKIKELNYTDSFFYALHFSSIRDRVQISYDTDRYVMFENLHKIKLADMLPFLYSMVAIAKENVNVLWERNNFAIDLTEKKVKAILFGFDGFPLYKKDNQTDGLKELILLALTKNHTILGKPKRADFIEKTDEVIQFSEDILTCSSVEEIEEVISSFEQQHHQKQAELATQKKKKIKVFPKGNEPKKIVENEPEKEKSSIKIGRINKNLLLKIGAVTLSFIVVSFITYNLYSSLDKKADAEINNEEDILVEALRASSLKDYDEAVKHFDKINYNNLTDEDKDVMLLSYLFTDQATKALELEPNFDETVVSYYKATHSMNKIKELNEIVSSKVIEYEIAVNDKDFEKIIELSKDVKIKNDRELDIIDAYIQLGDYEGAKEFAKENNFDDLLEEIKKAEKKGE